MQEKPLTDWHTGLLDCFEDASTCCYGFWCGPCLACTVSGRFGENYCLPLCDIFSPAIWTACGIPLVVPPAVLSLRASMRNKYGIKGSLCKDIAASCFCSWCSWCQMHRELKHRFQTPTVINIQSTNVVNMQPAPVMMERLVTTKLVVTIDAQGSTCHERLGDLFTMTNIASGNLCPVMLSNVC